MMFPRPPRPTNIVVTNVEEMEEDPKEFEKSKRRLLDKRNYEEGSMMFPRPPWPTNIVVTNVEEMKEDPKEFEKSKRRLLDKRNYEEGSMMLLRPRRPSTNIVVTNVKEMKEDPKEFEKSKRRLLDKRNYEEGSMMLRRQQRTSSKQHVVTNVKEMKEDAKEFGENKRRLLDKRKFEKGSVTSADDLSIRKSENIKKDEGDSHSMRAESMIGKDGGTLDIQNTGVSLEIPPGALRREYFIRMRIIPHHYLDGTELSFASNSSVVVELLPNNVLLLKPATLTLPHCLVLKKRCEWKATVYSSHHKEGTRPQWEEEINTQCELTYQNCVMRLYNFCWIKFTIGDEIVEAKRIVLFAAQRFSSTKYVTFLDVGYYWQLPGCRKVLKLNDATSLHEKPAVFYKKGQMPLTVLFEKVEPPIWRYKNRNKKKVIKFNTVAITKGSFCTFNLNKMGSDETDGCECFIKAGQGSDLEELMFSLKESSLSRAEDPPSAISQTIVRDEFLQELSRKLTKDWMVVGRKLGLKEEHLEILDLTYHKDHKEKVYKMLLEWKREKPSAATNGVLAYALKSAGRADLVKHFKPI